MTRVILVTNESTVLADSAVQAAMTAVQQQLNEHLCPVWGRTAPMLAFAGKKAPAGQEVIHILDDSDQADALGYHELDSSFVPEGFVFARTTEQAGDPWTLPFSHEACEQTINGSTLNLRYAPWLTHSVAALVEEVGDPVEAQTYTVDAVVVSNFVTPGWFLPGYSGQVDYMSLVKAPLTLAPGGYQSYMVTLGKWQQSFGDTSKAHRKLHNKYSRAARRHARWQVTL